MADGPAIYRRTQAWGDAINLGEVPERFYQGQEWKISGFKERIPQVGDILIIPTSGEDEALKATFSEVRPCGDPEDMFFATVVVEAVVKDSDYPDELLGNGEYMNFVRRLQGK